jgi:hypothetical protein
VCRAAKIDGE